MRTAAMGMVLAAVVAVASACTGGGAPCEAEFGYPHGDMPDLDMLVGDTVKTPLVNHFSRPDCFGGFEGGNGTWEIRSDDPAAVAVSVSEHVLTTVALKVTDSVRVTVKGSEEEMMDPGCLPRFLRVGSGPGGGPPSMNTACRYILTQCQFRSQLRILSCLSEARRSIIRPKIGDRRRASISLQAR